MEIRSGKIGRPNEVGANPKAEWRAAEQAALLEAQSTLAQGEQVYDLRIDTAVAERGNIGVMVYSYSYQVAKPGDQIITARHR